MRNDETKPRKVSTEMKNKASVVSSSLPHQLTHDNSDGGRRTSAVIAPQSLNARHANWLARSRARQTWLTDLFALQQGKLTVLPGIPRNAAHWARRAAWGKLRFRKCGPVIDLIENFKKTFDTHTPKTRAYAYISCVGICCFRLRFY